MSYVDYIDGWNTGYWMGRLDELAGLSYKTRTTNVQLELVLVGGTLVMPCEDMARQFP